MRTVGEYIEELGSLSRTERHEKIVECLEYFGLQGTRELTLEQAGEYYGMLTGIGKGEERWQTGSTWNIR